jgi:hypothetical protein
MNLSQKLQTGRRTTSVTSFPNAGMQPHSSIHRIASVNIPEERSMRSIYQEDAFGQEEACGAGADEASRPALSPPGGTARIARRAIGDCGGAV